MRSWVRGKFTRRAMVVAWGICGVGGGAEAGLFSGGRHGQKAQPAQMVYHAPANALVGTLGYGPPGLHPGFQGFGLKYHPGYGYGGDGLGVGAAGGYPSYGGPGYPHPAPPLRRFGRFIPYNYCGGPGYPTPDHPNFYGAVGPLISNEPVVTVGNDFGYDRGFGDFTGRLPYPDSYFAPFTAKAAVEGSTGGAILPTRDTLSPPPPAVNVPN